MRKDAVLIIAHGSKVKETDDIMKKYQQELVLKMPETQIEYCYLQLMEPSIESIVKSLYESGVRNIKAFPFFIFNGNHIKEDIPEVLDAIRAEYPELNITFLENIGYDEKVLDLIIERVSL
ncbi:sirohydrochlorin chelatase [Fusibacter ferrireducens]|uniref:CbiX/SirB N-terminal domain-containing protein n=1 Tax=Fusibacter ferrireducens TaxID=2785058 RepID=A0ABR9ZUK6_9FIRM|nr:CbiX/SirB N-terminal domain-containing protein [Fusibacter ferrireducens]MBF4693259.1 CbiX/SirB N-terminal domain-containing protein [Fusibacter ferrireducens]